MGLITSTSKKQIALLIDPDYADKEHLDIILKDAIKHKIDFLFVGGSLIHSGDMHSTIALLKERCDIPVLIFPGDHSHICNNADGILFLSLISGRNPEYLIGQQVISAPKIKQAKLQFIPTGYILINCGTQTAAEYISNTNGIPFNQPAIAACTALAGEMLGLKCIYMDGGSGANKPIESEMISKVKSQLSPSTPLIVGGGIKSKQEAKSIFEAGANVVVIGNAIEQNPNLIAELAEARY